MLSIMEEDQDGSREELTVNYGGREMVVEKSLPFSIVEEQGDSEELAINYEVRTRC